MSNVKIIMTIKDQNKMEVQNKIEKTSQTKHDFLNNQIDANTRRNQVAKVQSKEESK